ncbi:MAG: hypothetical protein LBP63_03890 [Prevotellaceae bacterium]|jgi:hypothetical protein|nr:hypothetical protein [Prevotellaceae bacterium]
MIVSLTPKQSEYLSKTFVDDETLYRLSVSYNTKRNVYPVYSKNALGKSELICYRSFGTNCVTVNAIESKDNAVVNKAVSDTIGLTLKKDVFAQSLFGKPLSELTHEQRKEVLMMFL